MDRIIGGVFGLAAFTAVLAASLSKGSTFGAAALRAVLALILGYWVGRLIFGVPGLAIVKEAAGPVPPQAPAWVESKPVNPTPGQAPGNRVL